jgi:hypothetical protein
MPVDAGLQAEAAEARTAGRVVEARRPTDAAVADVEGIRAAVEVLCADDGRSARAIDAHARAALHVEPARGPTADAVGADATRGVAVDGALVVDAARRRGGFGRRGAHAVAADEAGRARRVGAGLADGRPRRARARDGAKNDDRDERGERDARGTCDNE